MFNISMLPARFGDSLWIEYGDEAEPHRILIDGGPEYAYEAIEARIPAGGCHFELLVITHIDKDHIGGVLELLRRAPAGVTFGDVWFNGWKHLQAEDELGAVQGELVSLLIEDRDLPWNEAFDGKAVALGENGQLRDIPPLPGGMKLTLLSPGRAELRRLRDKWEDELIAEEMRPGSEEDARAELERRYPPDLLGEEGPPDPDRDIEDGFQSDTSAANGSSIVLLAEYEEKRALLCADAYPSLVLRGLSQLTGGKFDVDVLKISHHGSHKNTNMEEIEALRCSHYLVSTDGSYYKHPDNAALSRVVKCGGDWPTLYFNYRTVKTERWDDPTLRAEYDYKTVYPAVGGAGLTIEL